ncbi:type VI secretion system membrane subunit TssM [Acidovorax sp. NCPPB 3859]|nr:MULTISPECIES: type VI secretion system membrane subunit TssM [unclassified Acidovorax]MDA8452215.1 type VI secretion system membrane subunit TssM [Acidovorax sp. GBBC 3297]MDA8461661.1 type VI secretion system membrane subunit TssM [Acidovorax sp. GBBC 3333]MDA8466694.1 type VI secretion system membrane subunit TssM [Acidovorax sp. GBBC 3332]MDA8471703.1 type VI secretion system membrane subunit TssM [Acidovorax sp. GBBC 3299]WCM80167.1 type VI secretion system membrane subunit TssM [Acidov
MLRKIFSFFFNRITLVLCGLVLLSLLIWFVGPLVYIKPYQPLESEAVRGWIIAALFGIWFLRLFIRWWRAKEMNARLLGQLARIGASDASTPEAGPGKEEVAELEKRFKEAVDVLGKTRFGQTEQGWFGRLSRRYVYQLPWYLIIGSPGSGKTTALVNSGLDFPLAAQFGKASIRGVGGTRNCDWWFTDQAVLLDTAGRYTTQESDAAQDSAAWSGFLNLLRRFRGRQPINGVLVTLSVQELLSGGDAERERLARLIGLRLAELCEGLSIKFPVYVLVTKTDLLAGFNEFFGNMTREERAQVWGFTNPYVEGQAQEDPGVQFRKEFDGLADQINRLLPQRLLAEPDLARRGQIYGLPQQFVGLRDVVQQTLSTIFASSRFKEKPLFRGVYFTSGTQEGMPFDRVLSALSRRFSVSPPANLAGEGRAGKSYFIETLLKGVIFNEAGLTGRNAKKERQLRLLQAAGFFALAAGLAGATIAWTISHGNNQKYLDEVAAKVLTLKQAVEESRDADPENMVALLPLLNHAESLATSQRYTGDSPPLSWRYGLLQVPKVQTAADATYMRLLEDAWLPRLARHLRNSLQQASTANPEASYEALKVYLMLYDPERFNPRVVKAWMLNEWESTLPPALVQSGMLDQLAHHLDRLMEDRALVSPIPIDQPLVDEVRQRLAQLSPAQRAYSRLKQLLTTGTALPPDFTLVRAAGPEAPQVFTRRSGKPLTQGISGLFTYDGYYGVFSHELPKVTALLAQEETWVLGKAQGQRSVANEVMTGQLALEVKRLYLMEYAKVWEDFLADVRPVQMASLDQAGEQARLYSSANSSLEQFIRAVAKETTLGQKPGAGGSSTSSWLGEKINRIKEEQEQLSRLTGKRVNVGGLAATSSNLEADLVDFRFREYRRLAASNGSGPAPITASLQVLNEAAAVISSARQQISAGGTVPASLSPALERVRMEAKRVPPPLNTMYEDLASSTSALVGRDVRATVGSNLNATIGTFCRRAIGGRYPFTKGSSSDVTSDDFASLFSPGGMMDEFFRNTLQPMVDISATPWRFRQGVDGTPVGGSAALASFQRAATIRDVYFRAGGKVPSIRMDIKPLEMDASISQMVLDIDGEVLRYQHGPQIPKSMTWPGTRGTGQVRLQLTGGGAENTGLVTEGPWAVHRFFDKAQILPGSTPERFVAAFDIGGRKLRFEVTTGSVLNPFRLKAMEEFACPGNL